MRTETFGFRFDKLSEGWADVWISSGDKEIFADVSHLSDGLASLATAVEHVVRGRLQGAIWLWKFEPGVWELSLLRKTPKVIELTVRQGDDWINYRSDELTEIFRADVAARDFAEEIARGFNKLKAQLGQEGYYRSWGFPFPATQIDAISRWLDGEHFELQRWSSTAETSMDNE